jgi:uncharacterized Zn finger protein
VSVGDVRTRCSCPDPENPCKHAAAVLYLLAEDFDLDPFLIFAWRGLDREALLEALRSRRGSSEAVPELSVEGFWAPGDGFEGVRVAPEARGEPLVRALGPVGIDVGGRDLGAVLGDFLGG